MTLENISKQLNTLTTYKIRNHVVDTYPWSPSVWKYIAYFYNWLLCNSKTMGVIWSIHIDSFGYWNI